MTNKTTHVDVVVLGAGIIGVCTALQLQKRGMQVALLDRRGVAEEASFGNAGMLVRNAVVPYAFPTDMQLLLQCLTKQYGGFNYHLAYSLRHVNWLASFWWHSIGKRFQDLLQTTMPFLEKAVEEHHALLASTHEAELLRPVGWLPVYRTKKSFEKAQFTARKFEQYGVRYQVLAQQQLYQQFPALHGKLIGGIHWQDPEFCYDPQALVKQYFEQFCVQGGQFYVTDVERVLQQKNGVWSVELDLMHNLQAEHCVVCLGAWSKEFCQQFGYSFPLAYKRGYHMHYDFVGQEALTVPVTDVENGYVLAPMKQGIRLTAGVELADLNARATPIHLSKLEHKAKELLAIEGRQDFTPWMGVRPCFADMKPVISRAPRHKTLWFGFGHHHLGLSLGPLTGRLIAEMIIGEQPCVDVKPYSAERFA